MIGCALLEKIDQRLGPWQRFLNLPKLCFAETGRVPNEVNEPVLQHDLTSLVPTALTYYLTSTNSQAKAHFRALRRGALRSPSNDVYHVNGLGHLTNAA
jgi:hypothetical protein